MTSIRTVRDMLGDSPVPLASSRASRARVPRSDPKSMRTLVDRFRLGLAVSMSVASRGPSMVLPSLIIDEIQAASRHYLVLVAGGLWWVAGPNEFRATLDPAPFARLQRCERTETIQDPDLDFLLGRLMVPM